MMTEVTVGIEVLVGRELRGKKPLPATTENSIPLLKPRTVEPHQAGSIPA